jgi:hypothetical protein
MKGVVLEPYDLPERHSWDLIPFLWRKEETL